MPHDCLTCRHEGAGPDAIRCSNCNSGQSPTHSGWEPQFHLMVAALAKDGDAIIASLDADKAHNLHMAVGVAGEAGELLDAIKKHTIYGKPLDRVNVIEELGDLEFYMEGLRQRLGITREETIAANIAKLRVRYSGMTYTDTDAIQRADKQASVTSQAAIFAWLEERPIFEGDILFDKDGTRLRCVSPLWTDGYPLRLEILDKQPGDADFWATGTHFDGEQVLFWSDPSHLSRK